MINVFQPSLQEEELASVGEVFASQWIGKGGRTEEFEQKFASHLEIDPRLIHSISCCTEGLFQAISLLGITSGDEVVLPTVSFVGAANAVVHHGAKPVFCDVNPRSLNPTVANIAEKVTARTKAVILSHYGGVPCVMDEICGFAAVHGLAVIEDCACAVASRFGGTPCGTLGDIGIWSFDAMKILSTGDGGMLCCKTIEMAERVDQSLNLGLTARSGFSSGADERWWEFDVVCAGRRASMNDLSSAIGQVQLRKLPQFIARRRAISEFYDRAFSELPWLQTPPCLPAGSESSYYLYWLQMPPAQRDRLAVYLREQEIYTTFRYYPLHQVPFYGADARLPHAERAAATTLCIPVHQSLSDDDVSRIIDSVIQFGRRN